MRVYKHVPITPPEAARKAARRGLEARSRASASRKGGLSASEAAAQGITSGVNQAKRIAAGRTMNATQVHAFFSRHRGNYLKAVERGIPLEQSKIKQAWLLWGGEPMRRAVAKAVEKAKGPGKPGISIAKLLS